MFQILSTVDWITSEGDCCQTRVGGAHAPNLSEEMAEQLSYWALAMELGMSTEELGAAGWVADPDGPALEELPDGGSGWILTWEKDA